MSSQDNIKLVDVELTEEDRILRSTNRGARLLLAIEKQPKPPCVNTGNGEPCRYFRRCGTELLACRSFYAYTRQPVHRKEYDEWLAMEKIPNTKIYGKTYRPDKGKLE